MEAYIEQLLSQLTLEEKIGMIHGATLFRTAPVERLGIPSLCFSDGTMGVRGEYPDAEWRYLDNGDDLITYLPCASALASTWDRDLARELGRVLGAEARGRGKDVILAPGLNIKRMPLCGRNFEYLSEDPYLAGEMAAPLVQGIQSQDVAACAKHFAANSQETERLSVDSVVDRQTLEEIYFPAFRAAIEKGGLLTLMGAYNKLNGEHCCTSQTLLNDILRREWGYDGLIVSDWGGVHDTDAAAASALDVEMDVTYDFDGHFMADALLKKVRDGQIAEEVIDEKIRNILRLMLRLKMIGPNATARASGTYAAPEHRQTALEIARQGVVLLKNEKNILPLDPKKIKTLAVIGGNAVALHAFGGGSAELRALYEINPLLGIKKHLGGNVRVRYASGYGVPVAGARPEISWQASSTQSGAQRPKEPVLTQANIDEAVALAKESDAVIFVGGLNHDYDTEGLDRKDMVLPYGQDAVIEALLDARPDTVIVMIAGSPVEMPWLARAQSLVWSYYAGMEGGTALADVLFGKVSPNGRLAETFLKTAAQCPAKIDPIRAEYTEGTAVGYRYYNPTDTDVNFCFGHGLSYTHFAYDGLKIDDLCVSLRVKNVGNVRAKETVQLYIRDATAQRLRAFVQADLAPGEEKQIRFDLTDRDFSAYDTQKRGFTTVPGTYTIQIGASSRDIRLTGRVTITK